MEDDRDSGAMKRSTCSVESVGSSGSKSASRLEDSLDDDEGGGTIPDLTDDSGACAL